MNGAYAPLQLELYRALRCFSVLVAHRRFGKTVFAQNQLLRQAKAGPLPAPRPAYVAPPRCQAKAVA